MHGIHVVFTVSLVICPTGAELVCNTAGLQPVMLRMSPSLGTVSVLATVSISCFFAKILS